MPGNLLPTLREICLKLGVELRNREFSYLSATAEEAEDPELIDSYSGLIFRESDIVGLSPVVKLLDVGGVEVAGMRRVALEQIREMKLIDAMNTYRMCIQYLL